MPGAAEVGRSDVGAHLLALGFEPPDLLDPSRVTTALERTGQEGSHTRAGNLEPDDPGAERKDVRIVVLASQAGSNRVRCVNAAHAAHLVGDDRLAGAAATQDDRTVALPIRDRDGRRGDDVRVVDGLLGVRSEVHRLVPELADPRKDGAPELDRRVVRRHGNPHRSGQVRTDAGETPPRHSTPCRSLGM